MFNLLQISETPKDYSAAKVLIPLSGGINSAAVLCFLAKYQPKEKRPKELHLFYIHFAEHSPDTFKFVKDLIRYARREFENVKVKITRTSVLRYFARAGFIPHPTVSPCSSKLKIIPFQTYKTENEIDFELIGFVAEDFRRFKRKESKTKDSISEYPILEMSNANCFQIVKEQIGWYPAIYDIKENGKQMFAHNNCLPCKNMSGYPLERVAKYFPKYAMRAKQTAEQIGAYWGRDATADVFTCDVCERRG